MAETPKFCDSCGAAVQPGDLSCPGCHKLIFGEELANLASKAKTQEAAGKFAEAIAEWRRALELLPPHSTQAATIRDHILELEATIRTGNVGQAPTSEWVKKLGPLGLVIAFLLKSKGFALLLLTKAKFLFLGLGKLQTLLSMLATMGLYWSWYGWKFAVGFVLGIYVHEMGHVWALKHFGLRASAPMFIPGFGAFVSLYDSPADEGQDARIGLAGPLWGAGAALAMLLLQFTATSNVWLAIARATASINLFNLIPIWQLDGGRAFRALDRKQRIQLLVLIAVLWFATGQGLFFLVLLGAGYRAFWSKDYAARGDSTVFLQYAGLLILFGAMLGLIPILR